MALPTDSTHLSDQAQSEMIEEYAGEVDSQFAKASIMKMFFKVHNIKGTDTKIMRRAGRTTLQALTPGVRPDATPTEFGRVAVTVDTVIIARDNRSMLNEFQTDFDARAELGKDHGKEMSKFFDQAFFIQAIKGANDAAPANLNGAIGAGKNTTLAASGDEDDPDKLYAAIKGLIIEMEEEEIDPSELVVAVRPTEYGTLNDNDKLTSIEHSANGGDFAAGVVHTIYGAPIVKSARIPKAAIASHKLSNTANSNAYDVSAAEARARALIMHPKSLLAGETIPLTSHVWFNDEEKQWFIDSWMSFGVARNRPDVSGAVFAFD
jgi:hypothetical protein